jgi:hypothetical protein
MGHKSAILPSRPYLVLRFDLSARDASSDSPDLGSCTPHIKVRRPCRADRAVRQATSMLKAFRGARIPDYPASLPSPSLESRLGLLRRRRRLAHLKRLLPAMGPVLVGLSLLLLLATFGAVASLR